MIFHLLSIRNKRLWSLAQRSSLKGRASRWPLCLRVRFQTMNRQQATLPRHIDASCRRVVCAMTIQQSCCRGMSRLDIIDAGMLLAQSGGTTTSSISANWINGRKGRGCRMSGRMRAAASSVTPHWPRSSLEGPGRRRPAAYPPRYGRRGGVQHALYEGL